MKMNIHIMDTEIKIIHICGLSSVLIFQ